MNHKTTKKDFEYFKSRCEYWIEIFGLKQWKVYYKHEYSEEDLADCATNYAGKNATIRLNTCWYGVKVSKKEIDQTAFHEVMELLLSPLMALAQSREWDTVEYENSHHEVIRTLENIFVNKELR